MYDYLEGFMEVRLRLEFRGANEIGALSTLWQT